jgi:PAS domain S-box-containing protein
MTVDATSAELRLLLDTALDAVIAMAADGRIVAWSKQAEEIFGWRREDALGQVLASLIIPPDLRQAHWKGLERFLSTGEGPVINRRVEVRAMHKDGREFPAELTIVPLRQSDRLTFFAFVRDNSAAKEREAQLKTALREKEMLLGEMQHRVKNNLQVLMSMLTLASRDEDEPAPRYRFLNLVRRVRAMASVQDLLYRSKQLSAVDCRELFEELTQSIARSYGIPGVTASVHADSLQCDADTATAMALIVNELVSNAFRHAFPNGRVGKIDVNLVRDASGHAILSVSDDGIAAVHGHRGGGLSIVEAFAAKLNGVFERSTDTPKAFAVTFEWPNNHLQ